MLNILSWISLIYMVVCVIINFINTITQSKTGKRMGDLFGVIICSIITCVLYQYMFLL